MMPIFSARSIALAFISFISIINVNGIQKVLADDVVDTSTLEGKVLYGYQGFFRRPGQGNDHWTSKGGIPGPSTPGDGKCPPLRFVYTSIIIRPGGVPTFHESQEHADVSKFNSTCSLPSNNTQKNACSRATSSFPTAQTPPSSNPIAQGS